MPKFDIEFAFKRDAYTIGYQIEAADAGEAARKASACIDENGFLDFVAFEKAGGDLGNGSWDLSDGSDHAYEVNRITLDGEEQDDWHQEQRQTVSAVAKLTEAVEAAGGTLERTKAHLVAVLRRVKDGIAEAAGEQIVRNVREGREPL